jgi:hypothetical protein
MPRAGFENTIRVFEWSQTICAFATGKKFYLTSVIRVSSNTEDLKMTLKTLKRKSQF